MVLTVSHYRIWRGIRLFDSNISDWRLAFDGCALEQVGNVLDVLRAELSYPYNIDPPITHRHFETLRYYGLFETPPALWLELMAQPSRLPLGPPIGGI